MLRRIRAALPNHATITVKLGQSQAVRELFNGGELDLAIIRREANSAEGEVLGEDPLVWLGPAEWVMPNGPVPLAVLPPPCGVRAMALNALDHAGLAWREAFVGGSCLALGAAVRAGLGIAPLGRMVSAQFPELRILPELPPLRPSQIVMLARTPDVNAAARALAASVRDILKMAAINSAAGKWPS